LSKVEKILVVDDSSTVHKMIKRHLEPEGYQFCGFAKNGKEALELYREHCPHLTFMDITMPIMDGISTLQEIKKEDPGASIVMLSAMGDEELMQQAKEYGATVYLQKPFNKEKLLEAINQVQEGI